MSKSRLKNKIEKILSFADIKINDNRPWDIHIYNENFYKRVLNDGSLGLGESYMDHWWDGANLDQVFYKILKTNLDELFEYNWNLILGFLKSKLFNRQKYSRAFHVGKNHYDIGNDLYSYMLDKRMVYSCGYWKDAVNLDQAQEAKLDLVCRKLDLKKGMKILDIGCGWGSFAKYAAGKYRVEVVGITVSQRQVSYAKVLCKGLPVEIMLSDYRNIEGKFDRIVSLGMFEHVGYKNYGTYMSIANQHLKDDGLFLLQTIGGENPTKCNNHWIEKYIFPNSIIPSAKHITTAIKGLFFTEDWHEFGADYNKTLMSWYENFTYNWDKIKANYDDKFYRMWTYYLLSCAGLFRAGKKQLWQIVFSKKGASHDYQPIR
jgi:cyclopropane-fatty-acyl-phospholipid synthase